MTIQINTDRNIEGREALGQQAEAIVENSLGRFARQITRVEVHLSDENSHKSGTDDKRCVIEARLEGREPCAVTHQADTLEHAIDGAAAKLKRSLERTLGRLSGH